MKRMLIGILVSLMFATPTLADVDLQTMFSDKEKDKDGTFAITKDELIESMDIQSIEWDDNWIPIRAMLSGDIFVSSCYRADTNETLMLYINPHDFNDTLASVLIGAITYESRESALSSEEFDFTTPNHTAKGYSYMDLDGIYIDYSVNVGTQIVDFVLTCPWDESESIHNKDFLNMATSIVFNETEENQ